MTVLFETDVAEAGGVQETTLTDAQAKVTDYIDGTLSKVIRDIEIRPCVTPAITLRRLVSRRPRLDETGQQLDWDITDREVVYSFPGRTTAEAWRFACLGKILSEIYCAIQEGFILTKREIYYRDPELFKRQDIVDRYIDDIAHTCKVRRRDLNVEASPKGLFVDGRHEADAVQPTSETLGSQTGDGQLNWILVFEKEATFRTMIERKFHRNNGIGRGFLVTGKGYPDFATRHTIRAIVDAASEPKPPVFGFFDCDPDGMNIMQVYRQGSRANTSRMVATVPEMIWLGLKPHDMFTHAEDGSATMSLTQRDRNRAQTMLDDMCREIADDLSDVQTNERISALQLILMCGRKFEMQVLDDRPGGVVAWVESRISRELESRGL